MRQVAALYCLPDSVYRDLAGVDVWDKERDAMGYFGSSPVVAHPPCAQWSRLRACAKPDFFEKHCGVVAVEQVRAAGGVLEHPAASTLWKSLNLPAPGKRDSFGGVTFPVSQRWFGHPCEKLSLLYIVGVAAGDLPPFPIHMDMPVTTVSNQHSGKRNATPPAFAQWLVQLARRVH